MITQNCALFKKSLSAVALSLAFQSPYALAMDDIKQETNDQTCLISVWNKTPNEVMARFCLYQNDNTLLSFRVVDVNTSQIVDDEFRRRAAIKAPLVCLIQQDNEHPTPHTTSYFMRKRLWKIPELGKIYKKSAIDVKEATNEIYRKCAEFCTAWDYPAKNLMEFLGKKKLLDQELHYINFKLGLTNAINDMKSVAKNVDSNDSRELMLWGLAQEPLQRPHTVEDVETQEFFKILNAIIDNKGMEIGFYYVNLTAKILSDQKKMESNIHCIKSAYDLGNANEQYKLGCKFEKKNSEQAKIYYKMAIEQGHVEASFSLGILCCKEGDMEDAIRYWKMAANKRHAGALYSLAIEESNVEMAKMYYKKASDLGFTNAQLNLAIIYADEGNTKKSTKFYKKGADQGHAQCQFNLANNLAAEGKREKAIIYYKMAADQGYVGAPLNLGVLFYKEGMIEQAKFYWNLAAEQGCEKAMRNFQAIQGLEKSGIQ